MRVSLCFLLSKCYFYVFFFFFFNGKCYSCIIVILPNSCLFGKAS